MSYQDTDFEGWKAEGDVSEDLFPALMACYNVEVIKHPFGILSIDYGKKDLSEFYEVRQLGKEVEAWQLDQLGLDYPMVFDVAKCHKATAFYNSHVDKPQFVFLRLHYQKEWQHLNGWWVISMVKYLDRFWKDQYRDRGNYRRRPRNDEIKTGKTNVMKWHCPLALWDKIIDAEGNILRPYKEN